MLQPGFKAMSIQDLLQWRVPRPGQRDAGEGGEKVHQPPEEDQL